MRNPTLAIVGNFVPYLKELRPYAGSVTACILMQQLDFWFRHKPNGFFKFLQPTPNHEAYKEGDSWVEELAFSADEFRTAFDKIGKRYGSKREFDAAANKFAGSEKRGYDYFYCSYHDKIKGLTFYFRNHELVDRMLDEMMEASLDPRKSAFPIYGSGKPQSTEVGNPNLRKSGMPSYVNRECQSPLNTEITSETTTEITAKESCAFAQEDTVHSVVAEVVLDEAENLWSTEKPTKPFPVHPKHSENDQGSATDKTSKKEKPSKLAQDQIDWLLNEYNDRKPSNWCPIKLNPDTKAYKDRVKLLNALYKEHGDSLGELWPEVLQWLSQDEFWSQRASNPAFEALARPGNFVKRIEQMTAAATANNPMLNSTDRRFRESCERSLSAFAKANLNNLWETTSC